MIYRGSLTYETTPKPHARVAAVAGHRILAEASPDAHGRWILETEAPAEWIIASCRKNALAAVAATPAPEIPLTLPEMMDLSFTIERGGEGVSGNLAVWLDPVNLAGFPRKLVPALFSLPGGGTALHIAESLLSPGSEPAVFSLQQGRYRLSGGNVSLRPGAGPAALQLSGATCKSSGARTAAENGVVTIDVNGPDCYRLHFKTEEKPDQTIVLLKPE